MAYCMYLRKSRADLEAEARGEGETLSRHQRTLLLLADRLDISISPDAIYREIVSGDTIAARPMMQQLLQEVQDGKWEGVLCTEVERLARGDTIDQGLVAQAFKYSGTRIITPSKIYDPNNDMDEEYFEFSLFMARREYKAIKRRMQAGRAASVREGHYVGGKRPFGYEVVKIKNGKGYTLQPHPQEAPIVRQVFDWYLYAGIGCMEISNRLNAMGSTTYNGFRWTATAILKMLKLPVYAGYVQWLKRESRAKIENGVRTIKRPFSDQYIRARGLHDGIVTQEEFERAQDILASRRTIPKVDTSRLANPLAGLVHCAFCGYAMRRNASASGVFLKCLTPQCKCSSAHLDAVLSIVLDTLGAWVKEYSGKGTKAPARSARPDHSAAIDIARSSIETSKKQIIAAQDMLERGVYSIDEYLSRKSTLQEKIQSAQAEIQRLESFSRADDQSSAIARSIPQIRHILQAWPYATTAAEQNALLRSVLSRIDYKKTHRGTRADNPRDHISLTLHVLQIPKNE